MVVGEFKPNVWLQFTEKAMECNNKQMTSAVAANFDVLKIVPFPAFFNFVLSMQFIIQLIGSKQNCQWLDSKRGCLVLEATALPTAPQPMPSTFWCCMKNVKTGMMKKSGYDSHLESFHPKLVGIFAAVLGRGLHLEGFEPRPQVISRVQAFTVLVKNHHLE